MSVFNDTIAYDKHQVLLVLEIARYKRIDLVKDELSRRALVRRRIEIPAEKQQSWRVRIEIRIVTSHRPMSGISSLDAIVLERRACTACNSHSDLFSSYAHEPTHIP